MARVPYNPVPTQDPNENIKLPATGGSFGAGIGEELGQFGQRIVGFGLQLAENELVRQGLENELITNDENTAALNEIAAAYSEYQRNEGRAAQTALPSFQMKLNEIKERSLAKMPGLESKAQLSRALGFTIGSYTNYARSHADREFGKWMDASSTAAYNAMKNQAVLAQNNPEQMEVFIDGATDQVRKLLEAQGWDEAIIEDKVKDKESEILTAVINSAFQRDPLRAKAIYDGYAAHIMEGDRLDIDQMFRTFNTDVEADRLAQRISSGGTTADLIRQEEGFREGAYWDVNAYRTGYGSDTYTTADGQVHAVTADTRITREDAERDLSRRIGEFAGRAAIKIGEDAWNGLTDGARAAITSVTYNYGNTPDSVSEAAKTGDPQKIADAIAALPANPARRQREAAVALGGLIPKPDAIEQVLKETQDRPDLRSRTLSFMEHRYNVEEARIADVAKQNQLDTLIRKRKSDEAEQMLLPYMFPELTGKKPPPNMGQIINNSDLLPDAKRQMLQLYKSSLEEDSVSSQEDAINSAELLRRMRLPPGDPERINDSAPLFQAVIDKKIKRTSFDWLDKVQKEARTPEGETLNRVLTQFYSSYKTSITMSEEFPGGQRYPDQDRSWFDFQRYVERQLQKYQREGKNWMDLFTRGKPEFLGNPAILAPFQKSMQQRMRELSDKFSDEAIDVGRGNVENKSDRLFMPPDLPLTPKGLLPMQPGETIEQYNKRTSFNPSNFKNMSFDDKLSMVETMLG